MASDTTTGQSGLAYITMSGTGNLVSTIEVVTDVFTNGGCNIQSLDPAFINLDADTPSPTSIEFEFDGTSMSVSASSQGDEFTEGCTVEFTAIVASRGTQQVLFGFNTFDVTIPGRALVSGEPVRFAPLQLNRIRTPKPIACEEPPTDLDGSSFSISNVNSATFIPTPPSADATVVNIDGFDEAIFSVSLVGGGLAGCFGEGGTFSFDGTNLTFESSFPAFLPPPFDPNCNDDCQFTSNGQLAFNVQCDDGRDGATSGDCPAGSDCSDCGPLVSLSPPTEEGQIVNGGEGELPGAEPTTCSITFSGKVAECGVYLSPILGFSPAQEVLTIKGTGAFTDGVNSGELTTLYLTIHRGGGLFPFEE